MEKVLWLIIAVKLYNSRYKRKNATLKIIIKSLHENVFSEIDKIR